MRRPRTTVAHAALPAALLALLALAALGVAAPGAAGAATGAPLLTAGQLRLDGSTVGARTTVALSSPGAAVSVTFVLDGRYLGVDRAAPFSWAVTAAPGRHRLRARAVTAAGAQTRTTAAFQVAASATAGPVPTAPAPPTRVTAAVTVHDGPSLAAALAAARPGASIQLADGSYTAARAFTATTACTASAPCRLHGTRQAVLDGGGLGGHYGLHLQGAAYWTLSGFTVTRASKGIVLDGSRHDVVEGVEVHETGAEGVHLRAFSSDDVVKDSLVHHTGRTVPAYGEGIYVGSAVSNWATYSGGMPDASDRALVTGNTVWATGAESVDVKEGTTGGVLSANTFDGAGMSGANGADSWVDVKGNSWSVVGNTGHHALLDGYQTHVAVTGWGSRNTFAGNLLDVEAAGYGVRVQGPSTTGNVVRCDNTAAGAALGLANLRCS